MKYILNLLILVCLLQTAFAQNKKAGINWMTLEEVEERMKTEPKKVYIDVYTDWCHWCKIMDKKTFTNNSVIEYMNQNFYCVHFNAERKDAVTFGGKKYGPGPGKTNELIVAWMQGQLTYPTSIFFDEGFQNPQPVPGYMEVPTMELIAKYISGNKHKTMPFDKYKATFVATWK